MKFITSISVLIFLSLNIFSVNLLSLDIDSLSLIANNIINLHKLRETNQPVKAYDAVQQACSNLENLKNRFPEDRALLQLLQKTIQQDNNPHLSFIDLVHALSAMEKVFEAERIEGMKAQLAELLRDLVLGKQHIKNVVVVGRTRSGKSTLLSMLIDPFDKKLKDIISRDSLFSHTVDASHYWVIFKSLTGLCIARIVDTPGLSEIKSIYDSNARSDEEIINTIADSLKGLKIHKVIQIFPIGAGFNRDDFKSFDTIKTTFSERNLYDGPIHLVFPKADDFAAESHKFLIGQLLSLFPTFENQGKPERVFGEVLLTGTWYNYEFENGNRDSVMVKSTRILKLRNILLGTIFNEEFTEYLETDGQRARISDDAAQKLSELIPEPPADEYTTLHW